MWETIKEKYSSLPMQSKAFLLVLLLPLLALVINWYKPDPKPVATPVYTQAQPSKDVASVPKKKMPLKQGATVLDKEKLKDKVDLPPEVEEGDDEVTSVTEAPPSDTKTTIVTTIDPNTGNTKVYVKPEKPDLFEFENKKRIGVGYGYSTEGTHARVLGDWTFFRVGAFHLSVAGEVNAVTNHAPDAKVLGIVDYRW